MEGRCCVQDDAEDSLAQGDSESGDFFLPKHARRVLQLHPSQYRDAFLSILRGGDAIAATAAVRVLLALLLCRSVDNALLDAAGPRLSALRDCGLMKCCMKWRMPGQRARWHGLLASGGRSTYGQVQRRAWMQSGVQLLTGPRGGLQAYCLPSGESSGTCSMR